MSRVPEGVTQINITNIQVEFVNAHWKIVIRRDHYNNANGLNWYTVETFGKTGLVGWLQESRWLMPHTDYDYRYNALTEQVMGMEQQLDPKQVSLEVFTALCKSLA